MLQWVKKITGRLKLRKLEPLLLRPYAKWNTQKRGKKIAIISSFVVLLTISIVGVNYLNKTHATWNNLITWSTQADFETNTTSTTNNGTSPAATTKTNVDTTTGIDDVKIAKSGDIGKTMAGGMYSSYIVKNNGSLWVSGGNQFGQLGLGDISPRNSFTEVTDVNIGTNVSSVAASPYNSSAFIIKKDGTLWATGQNTVNISYGNLGLGDRVDKKVWTNTGLSDVKQVSVGYDHTLVLKNDGTVWGTGGNGSYQLGTVGSNGAGRNSWSQLLDANAPKTDALFVAAGYSNSYVVKKDNTMWVAGANTSGQLGLGNTNPISGWVSGGVTGVKKAVAVSSGAFILKTSGELFVAGFSQGSGFYPAFSYNYWVTTSYSDVVDVDSSGNHSIILRSNGQLLAAGSGNNGTFGSLITGSMMSSTPGWFFVNYANNAPVNIACGNTTTFILGSDSKAYISGFGTNGQLGSGDIITSDRLINTGFSGVNGSSNSGKVASVGTTQFLIKSDGTLWVTGYGANFASGFGDYGGSTGGMNKYEFTQATRMGNNNVKVVGYIGGAVLVLKSDDTVWANYGAATGSGISSTSEVWVQTLTNVADISADSGSSMALKKTNGEVWVAGTNSNQQLGTGGGSPVTWTQAKFNASTPVTGATKISMSSTHALIVVGDISGGELYAAGLNVSYQLGNGGTLTSQYFTKSSPARTAADITNGVKISNVWTSNSNSSFIKKTDGTVWAVGSDSQGQFGFAAGNAACTSWSSTNCTVWTNISGFNDALDISTNGTGIFILKSNNELYAAGSNSSNGELAIGQLNSLLSTSYYKIAEGIAGMSLGSSQSIAYTTTGQVYTAGLNSNGQLGIVGTADKRYWQTARDSGFSGVSTSSADNVSNGITSNYIVKDGDLWVNGGNYHGQLGLGDNFSRQSFTKTSMSNVKKVVAGPASVLVLKNDGTVWGSGYNIYGQLGTGDLLSKNTFTQVKDNSGAFLTDIIDVSTSSQYSDLSTAISGFSLAIRLDPINSERTVWATGYNGNGQLGLGDLVTRNSWNKVKTDVTPTYITGATYISAGSSHSLIVAGGELYGAGVNSSYQLGLNNTTQQTFFTKSTVARNATDITNSVTISKVWAGCDSNSFMQKSDGEMWVIGANSYGTLGLGDLISRTSWTNLPGFNGAVSVKLQTSYNMISGASGSMILKSDHTLYAAGRYLNLGDLGSGTTKSSFNLVGSDFAGASINYNGDLIGYKMDGKVYVSGSNIDGQLNTTPFYFSGTRYGFSSIAESVNKQNTNYPGLYMTEGTISKLKVNAGIGKTYRWYSLAWSADLPTNTAVKFRVRYASSEVGLDSASWSAYITTSGQVISSITAPSQWIEVEATLNSSDSISTPVLHDFSLTGYSDMTAPTNPTALAWTDNTKADGTSIANDIFKNDEQPYFELSGADDGVVTEGGDNSGVAGYYVYFGTNESINPYEIPNSYQASTGSGPQVFVPPAMTVDDTYYLRVVTIDNAYNMSAPQTQFIYKYDKTTPTSPTFLSVDPFGWSTTNSFSFNWDDGFDTTGTHQSQTVAYQYKICGTDTADWSHETVGQTSSLSISGITACIDHLDGSGNPVYKNGISVLYLRSIDGAGNVSSIRQVNYRFSGSAPSKPLLPTVSDLPLAPVTPQTSNDNSFTFTWKSPENPIRPIVEYRYSVNAKPDENNTTSIKLASLPPEATVVNGWLILKNIPAATKQEFNVLYVVAVDEGGNVAYSEGNYAEINFECNTPSPGIPLEVDTVDTSSKQAEKYSIVYNWVAPKDVGIGINDYAIYRSTDGTNYGTTPYGVTSGTSFMDRDLSNTTRYYYRVAARDSSGKSSSLSAVNFTRNKVTGQMEAGIIPTGKYVTPPAITVPPEVSAKVSTASFKWVTDREATSYVEYGETSKFGLSQNGVDFPGRSVEHVVNLVGLKPETTYYYHVGYDDEDGNMVNSENNPEYSEVGTFTTQPAPRVERVSIQDVRLYTAILTWYTSEPANSDLVYGKTSNYSNEIKNVSGGLTTVHSVRLDGLDHSSTYHFAIKITDVDGNEITSDDYSFDTQQYPELSNVKFQPMTDQSTSTFKITWDSNVPTTSVVEYSPEGGKSQEAVKTKLDLKHEIIISGLFDNTYYLINTVGVDQYGNRVISDQQRVKTNYDTRPPLLTIPSVEVSSTDFGAQSKSQVVVSWETDEPSTSQVGYGVGVTGGNYDSISQEDAVLTTSHVVIITGLSPSSAYHLRAVSADASGNKGVSEQESILTEQARSSILDIIIGSLQSSLGWLLGMK